MSGSRSCRLTSSSAYGSVRAHHMKWTMVNSLRFTLVYGGPCSVPVAKAHGPQILLCGCCQLLQGGECMERAVEQLVCLRHCSRELSTVSALWEEPWGRRFSSS